MNIIPEGDFEAAIYVVFGRKKCIKLVSCQNLLDARCTNGLSEVLAICFATDTVLYDHRLANIPRGVWWGSRNLYS